MNNAYPNIIASAQTAYNATQLPIKKTPGSYRVLLLGDSMTDMYNVVNSVTATFDRNSGILTVTDAAGNAGLATGAPVFFWHKGYTSTTKQQRVIANRVSSTVFTCQLPINYDLPNGALSSTGLVRYPHRINDMSWVAWLQMLCGQPFRIVANSAQSGDTVQQVINRWDNDVAPYDFDVILMQMPGINDQLTTNGSLSESVTTTAIYTLLDMCANTGAFCVIASITPVFTGEVRATAAIMQRVQRLNAKIKAYCQGKPSFLFLDHYRQIINPSSTTGLARSGLLKAADNIHYNVPGARTIGAADQASIQATFPSTFDSRPTSQLDCFTNSAVSVTNATTTRVGGVVTVTATAHGFKVGERVRIVGATGVSADINGFWTIATVPTANTFTFLSTTANTADFSASTGTVTAGQSFNLYPNPVLTTAASGGTVTAPHTGTAAQYVNVLNVSGTTNTATASVVAHPSIPSIGNVQQIAITTGANGDLTGIQSTSVTSLMNGTMAAGQRFIVEAEMFLSSTNWANTPISEVNFTFAVVADGTTYEVRGSEFNESGVSAGITASTTLYLRTPEMTIPPCAAVSQAYFTIAVRTAAAWGPATDTLTVQIGRIAVWQTA